LANSVPPRAEKRPQIIEAHGDKRDDPWFWLRSREDDPAVDRYLKAENQFTQEYFSDALDLEEKLFQELKRKVAEDDRGVPVQEGEYWYFSEIRKGQQYSSYYRSHHRDGRDPELLLDMNRLAASHSFCDLAYCVNSPDHRYLAYAVDYTGDETYTLRVKDLTSGSDIDLCIEGVSDSFEWYQDSQTFCYNTLDDNMRPKWIWQQSLREPDKKRLMYEEKDERFFVSLDKSESDRFIYICADGHNMSEYYFLNARDVKDEPSLIWIREPEHEYDVSDHGEHFYIKTNKQAEDGKIVRVPLSSPSPDNQEEFIAHEKGRQIEGFVLFENHMVLQEKRCCRPGLKIIDLTTGMSHEPEFKDDIFDLSIQECRDFSSRELRFCYQSMNCSPEIYSYHLESRKRVLLKKYSVPDPDFCEDQYKTELIFTEEKDELPSVPVSLVYRKDLKLSSDTPLVLFAYRAYGCSAEADFRGSVLPLLDRGYIYAQAHVRGGMDLGWHWYQEGKLLKKKNTFVDYLSAARHLIAKGYTGQGNIIATSGSAGGLLLGYVANEAPELFRGILAHVPFVDILSTMSDDSLPLTTAEYNEWGNPSDKEFYDYIKSYSPFDNVKEQEYPSVFAIGGLSDMRVTYWEPAKWIAKIRDCNKGSSPVLLKTQWDSGHGGASGRYDSIREQATELTYMLKLFNIRS